MASDRADSPLSTHEKAKMDSIVKQLDDLDLRLAQLGKAFYELRKDVRALRWKDVVL